MRQRPPGQVHVVADVGLLLRRNGAERIVRGDFAVQFVHQLTQGQKSARLHLFGVDVVGDHGARIGIGCAGWHVPVENLSRLHGSGDEALHLRRACIVVQRVGGGHGADKDQHDEAHALLPVV